MFGNRTKAPWPPPQREEFGARFKAVISNITEVVTGGILRAGKTAYGTGTGWWLGLDPADNECKFDIGTPTNYFRYDETNGVQIKADGSAMTNIAGGSIQTGTIMLAGLAPAITDRMFNTGTLSDNIQAWIHAGDATLIDGGKIYTNTIVVAGLASAVTDRMFNTGTLSHNIQAWIHAADVTLIDGGKIYADTVTATQIAAATITATQIAANTITAAQIAAATITAAEIAATTITAAKLEIGTLTYEQLALGLISDNLVTNAGFETGNANPHDTSLHGGGTWTVQDTIKRSGAYALKYDPDGQQQTAALCLNGHPSLSNYLYRHVTAVEGRQFTFELYGYRAAGTTANVIRGYTRFYNAASSLLNSYYTTWDPADWTDNTWTLETSTKTTPPSAAYVVWEILILHDGETGPVYLDDINCRATIGASLIEANCITATHIAAGTITANEIAAATITATELAAGSVDTAELAAGAVTAAKIEAGTITATEIASNAVTAAKINVANLQAISAQTGALTVDNTLTMGAAGIITWMSGAAKITDDYMDVALTTSNRYAFRFLDGANVHAYFGAYKSANLTQVSIEVIGPAADKYAKFAISAIECLTGEPETVDFTVRSDTGVLFSALNYGAARILKVDTMDAWFTNKLSIGGSAPTERLEISDNTALAALIRAFSTTATYAGAPSLGLRKSHNNTIATLTETIDGERIGGITFAGVTSGSAWRGGAAILVNQDGAATGSDVPMALLFYAATNDEIMRITAATRLGLATTAPGQIFDINEGSGNMIADGYDTHSLAHYKENKKLVGDLLQPLQAISIYEYTRVPHVSAIELRRAALHQFGMQRWLHAFPADNYRGAKLQQCPDPEMLAFINATADRLREERRQLPKWQRKHYGLIADDPALAANLPSLISRDDDGNVAGTSLSDQVGLLMAAVQQLALRLPPLPRGPTP